MKSALSSRPALEPKSRAQPLTGDAHAQAQQRILQAMQGAGEASAAAKLKAFYAKHPLRTPRKGSKGATELLRDARDGGYRR